MTLENLMKLQAMLKGGRDDLVAEILKDKDEDILSNSSRIRDLSDLYNLISHIEVAINQERERQSSTPSLANSQR